MTLDESHIKAAIIGLWRQGAEPAQIEDQLYVDLVSFRPRLIYSTLMDYIKQVIANHKPKK